MYVPFTLDPVWQARYDSKYVFLDICLRVMTRWAMRMQNGNKNENNYWFNVVFSRDIFPSCVLSLSCPFSLALSRFLKRFSLCLSHTQSHTCVHRACMKVEAVFSPHLYFGMPHLSFSTSCCHTHIYKIHTQTHRFSCDWMRIVKILAERKISCLWSTVHEGCHIERASVLPSQIKHLFLLLHIRNFVYLEGSAHRAPLPTVKTKIVSRHNFIINASGFWSSIVANGNKFSSVKYNLRGLKTNQNIKLAKSERIRIKSAKENLYIHSYSFSLFSSRNEKERNDKRSCQIIKSFRTTTTKPVSSISSSISK